MATSTIRKGSENTSPLYDVYFMQANAVPTALTVLAVIDEFTVTVASAAAFTVGDICFIASGARFYQAGILSIVGNVLTLNTPIDFAYPVGATVLTMSNNLAVDGSSTAQTFIVEGGANLTVDVHRVILTITDGNAMDDSLFGSLTALTKGMVLRKTNDETRNIATARKNGDFRVFAYDVEYLDKVGGGKFGVGIRFTFGGASKHGTIIRLEPGDRLEAIIQDDLTGLDEMLMTAQGHVVE